MTTVEMENKMGYGQKWRNIIHFSRQVHPSLPFVTKHEQKIQSKNQKNAEINDLQETW